MACLVEALQNSSSEVPPGPRETELRAHSQLTPPTAEELYGDTRTMGTKKANNCFRLQDWDRKRERGATNVKAEYQRFKKKGNRIWSNYGRLI